MWLMVTCVNNSTPWNQESRNPLQKNLTGIRVRCQRNLRTFELVLLSKNYLVNQLCRSKSACLYFVTDVSTESLYSLFLYHATEVSRCFVPIMLDCGRKRWNSIVFTFSTKLSNKSDIYINEMLLFIVWSQIPNIILKNLMEHFRFKGVHILKIQIRVVNCWRECIVWVTIKLVFIFNVL